ncbi:MAG: hypothetical protein K1X79_05800 [Oligoflexia bacterium]|nr:hypothetical protein [Oligoflexia bacterium]
MAQNPNYQGPPPRSAEIESYYAKGDSYSSYSEEVLTVKSDYVHRKIAIQTHAGAINIDYFAGPEKSEDLIFVFPVLGGKNIIADYFARYFAQHGFDTAIVNRVDDFKDPSKFYQLEEVFRQNVVRDRLAIDFFEREYGKKNFGTFGISRGAINVAISAGVDPRLKYNVMAMGGTDLVSLFKESDQRGITKYRNRVMAYHNLTEEEFYSQLERQIKTDPKNLAQFIDGRNSLVVLSVFDHAVPFKYGEQLREQLGNPRTVYVAAGHLTSILYTQYAKLLLPFRELCLFPRDYIESEALSFYRSSFKRDEYSWWMLPYRVLQLPFSLLGSALAN